MDNDGTVTRAPGSAAPGTWLAICALAYASLHHLGFATADLGSIGTTRWGDWLDLITPFAVLGPAAMAIAGTRPRPALWGTFAVGAVLYIEGHGIHLAANSIGNAQPGPTAHLWDEVVGHYLWYSGVALIMASLAATFGPLPAQPASLSRALLHKALAVAVGVTWATNGLEGGTVPLSLAVAVAFLAGAHILCRKGRLSGTSSALIHWAFLPALLIFAVYGTSHGGFPQPSELAMIPVGVQH